MSGTEETTTPSTPASLDERIDNSIFTLPPDFGMKVLSFVTQTVKFLASAITGVTTVAKDIYRAVQPNVYVFFKDSTFPYRVADYNLAAPGIPPIAWYYSSKDNVFLTSELFDSTGHFNTHHIPWLTAQIKYNDLVLYDISDFIQNVRWAGEPEQRFPNPLVLLAAWSLQSGIILHNSDGMKLEVINDNGDIENVNLR